MSCSKSEGPKSKVRQINILGNTVVPDNKLREQIGDQAGTACRRC